LIAQGSQDFAILLHIVQQRNTHTGHMMPSLKIYIRGGVVSGQSANTQIVQRGFNPQSFKFTFAMLLINCAGIAALLISAALPFAAARPSDLGQSGCQSNEFW
jgi:hypothetical protein